MVWAKTGFSGLVSCLGLHSLGENGLQSLWASLVWGVMDWSGWRSERFGEPPPATIWTLASIVVCFLVHDPRPRFDVEDDADVEDEYEDEYRSTATSGDDCAVAGSGTLIHGFMG